MQPQDPQEVAVGPLDSKTIRIGDAKFMMTSGEWAQLKKWLHGAPPRPSEQAKAFQWWASQFGMSASRAVYFINVVQAGLMTGKLQ
jgi:hypothetical protein